MKLRLACVLTILIELFQLTSANFDIYWEHHWDVRYPHAGYKVFGDKPRNCGDPAAAPRFDYSDDVSGNKKGVRCEGQGCVADFDPGSITVMEMHFGNRPLLHWTIYRDRPPNEKYQMFPLKGRSEGYCFPYPNDEYVCNVDHGYRKVRCITHYTADEINASRFASLNGTESGGG
ncbi:hypothetical protein N0V90_006306 [Kalmusia sp. IMI 367209]|nr:hypothetical protein N0V90_006306 [Kalmusia sp. IMI 367209]